MVSECFSSSRYSMLWERRVGYLLFVKVRIVCIEELLVELNLIR